MEVLWEIVDSKGHHPITITLCRLRCMIITCFVSVLINAIVNSAPVKCIVNIVSN